MDFPPFLDKCIQSWQESVKISLLSPYRILILWYCGALLSQCYFMTRKCCDIKCLACLWDWPMIDQRNVRNVVKLSNLSDDEKQKSHLPFFIIFRLCHACYDATKTPGLLATYSHIHIQIILTIIISGDYFWWLWSK